jgi:hypothetical protein
MNTNRVGDLLQAVAPQAVPLAPGAFMVCPAVLQPACCRSLSIYEIALQQAQAALQPAPRELDLFSVWN